ncbi:hypothetical protein ACHAPA_004116 [Fusarium lateritium]
MALSLRDRSPLKPEIRLAQAVSEFEALLTSEQKISFSASRSSAASTAPSMSDVMRLTAEVDLKATSKHGRGRCFGPRMTNILQSIQQFAALGDVVIGGSQNLIACGVWAAARMTLHVMTGYFTYLEKLSLLFMAVGRSAPRYQALAVIYPKSKNLQRYLYEYFIIVTRLCHQSVSWTQKSSLNRLSSTISDPDMKNFQSDLEVWSTSIKEEANLLLNQKVDDEATKNSSFRTWIINREGRLHWQEKIKARVAFLNACSKYDYRTPWKQTRKHGTTSILKSCDQYQQWKASQSDNRSLIVHGKLGAGKSVLLANIVDDLNLQDNTIVMYLFSRHDDVSSLQTRTIFGSLLRQLLEIYVTDDSFSHIFVDTISSFDLDDIIAIFRKLTTHSRQVYVVLDGLDECPFEEQETARRCLPVLHSIGCKLCVSVRTPEKTTIWDQEAFHFRVSISENNPDIVDYVQAEVDNRVRDGRLATRDPVLVKDIKEELMRGAGGMFLWVTMQLESICMEISDHDIREAIKNLPRDLTQTYERNLTNANAKDSKAHHIKIFKLLVGARELLTTDQIREAVSVTIGNTTWDPSREVSDIHAVLRFCGSLVMVDEEDSTVRFIHHSARSFCHNSPHNGAEWTFTKKQADENMAATLVTYLGYNVFETRLSSYRVPKIDANDIPKKIISTAISKRHIGVSLAEKLMKPRSLKRHDLGPVLTEASAFKKGEEHQEFFLLPYARKHWIQHTAHLDELSLLPEWYHLLDHPIFGIDLDDISVEETIPPRSYAPESHPKASRQMIWALQHGHILLLKHELVARRGVRRLQAYVALWIYLRKIEPVTIRNNMEHHLVKWLCPMFLRLRLRHPAKYHFLNCISIFDANYIGIIKEAISFGDTQAVAALLHHDNLARSEVYSIAPQLIELSILWRQTKVLSPLIKSGIASNLHNNTTNMIRVATSDMPDATALRFIHLFLEAGIDRSMLQDSEFYIAIKLLCSYTRASQAISELLFPSAETRTLITPHRKGSLLHRACLRGDVKVAALLLRSSSKPNTSTNEGSCLDATLYGLSQDRLGLAWFLLDFAAKPERATVVRAIQLRQWTLALYLLVAYTVFNKSRGISGIEFQYRFHFVDTFDGLDDVDRLMWPSYPPPWIIRNGSRVDFRSVSQLSILHSNSWLDWQFFFSPSFILEDGWRMLTSQKEESLTKDVYEAMLSMPPQDAHVELPTSTTQEDSPNIIQTSFHYVYHGTEKCPWIKVTTSNSFAIVAEVSRHWNWLSVEVQCEDTDTVRHGQGPDEASFAIRREHDGTVIWELSQSTDEREQIQTSIDQRQRRWGLIRSGLAQSQWAVRELNKSLVLLQRLPEPVMFTVPVGKSPANCLPRWPTSGYSDVARFTFSFAYMSVRIQWLRTLGLLLTKGSMTPLDFRIELLQDLGDIYNDMPGAVRHDIIYHHRIMPLTLETAFFGPDLSHYLASNLRRNSDWLPEVIHWLTHVDPTIFTWGMGRDAPLSFTRAFESFRKVGVSKDKMDKLESALEIARSKVVELM